MDNLMFAPGTLQLGKPGFAAGTTTTHTITTAFNYMIAGKPYSKAAGSNTATPTTDANTGVAFLPIVANQGTVFIWCVDSTGALKVVQGQVAALDSAGSFILAPSLPAIPDGACPFATLVVRGASNLASTWTLGANNLSSVTGMTYSFADLGTLPGRPVVA